MSEPAGRRLMSWKPDLVIRRLPGSSHLIMNFSENGGQCPWLAPDNRCTIYANRPDACRTFPHQPTPDCLVWPVETPWAPRGAPSPTRTGG